MAALSRLAVDDQLDLGDGSRYVGSFRAHGRLVPVWDLDRDAHASEWDEPVRQFGARLDQALLKLRDAPFGQVLLVAVAIGLACYGAFNIAKAWYLRQH